MRKLRHRFAVYFGLAEPTEEDLRRPPRPPLTTQRKAMHLCFWALIFALVWALTHNAGALESALAGLSFLVAMVAFDVFIKWRVNRG